MESQSETEHFLRLAIALAKQARAQGNEPFGAVLVYDGIAVHQATDRTLELCNPLMHAEIACISEYCQASHQIALENYTLYTSCEPCEMCASAIHQAKISRVVFSVSQAMFDQLRTGNPNCGGTRLLVESGAPVEVIGPLLADEGLAVFEGYVFESKQARYHRRMAAGGREDAPAGPEHPSR